MSQGPRSPAATPESVRQRLLILTTGGGDYTLSSENRYTRTLHAAPARGTASQPPLTTGPRGITSLLDDDDRRREDIALLHANLLWRRVQRSRLEQPTSTTKTQLGPRPPLCRACPGCDMRFCDGAARRLFDDPAPQPGTKPLGNSITARTTMEPRRHDKIYPRRDHREAPHPAPPSCNFISHWSPP